MTFLFWSVGLVVFGAILYLADRFYGVGIKRAIWNLTHGPKNKMSKGEEKYGFIYGQMVRSRVFLITFLMLVQFVVSFVAFHVNPFLDLLWSVYGIVLIVVGTYLGPYLDRFVGVADNSLSHIEGLEQRIRSGETTLGNEVRAGAATARARIYPDAAPASKPAAATTAPPPPAEPADDGRASLDRFLGNSK